MDCLLRDYITRDGLSARGAAERMGIGRNSVIGRAKRIGLKLNHSIAVPYSNIPRPMKFKPVPVIPPVIEAPKYLNMSIEALESGHCRYPHGTEAPFDFCGVPVKSNSPWCEYHASVCVVPAKPRAA